ncbi:type I-D CRISPR-associated protein Cas10d/Csc3 [Microcystis aeruginosa]|uniref:Type I-D CRISPR-associated protein Cas10d/Csc3 n=1 Tax=Microcystis aeruginosa 11-30S32 TaxID=2358142 RepID=A0A510PJ65_MICAE|nr:type I-D CRISPR-associated protein Cas10d/Csc3 [Microcystis aeruginosa]GCA93878.1 type I-D CRISPR-associated protein Cas10d/Csc3 [Microcystis aeruginosa 11-30S32]
MPKKQKKLEETGQLNLFDNTTEIDDEDLDSDFEDIDLESLSGEDLGISESVSDRRVETVRQLLTLKLLREAIRAENPDDRVMADFAEMVLPNLLRLAIGVTAKGGNFFEEIDRRRELEGKGKVRRDNAGDQSLNTHLLNGLFPANLIEKRLEKLNTTVRRVVKECERRLAIAGFILHDFEKFRYSLFPAMPAKYIEINEDFDRDIRKLSREEHREIFQVLVPELGLDRFLFSDQPKKWTEYLDDLIYIAKNAQRRNDTDRNTSEDGLNTRLNNSALESLTDLACLADRLASIIKHPHDAEKASLQDLLYSLSDGELKFTYHSIAENRGVLTNVLNNAVMEAHQELDYQPLLYLPTGVVYIAPKNAPEVSLETLPNRVVDTIKSLCSGELQRKQTGFGRDGKGMKYADYYSQFFDDAGLMRAALNATLRILGDNKASVAGSRGENLIKFQQQGVLPRDYDFHCEDDIRIDRLAEFGDVVTRKIWGDRLEKIEQARKLQKNLPAPPDLDLISEIAHYWNLENYLPQIRAIKCINESLKELKLKGNTGGVPYEWYYLAAQYLKQHPGIEDIRPVAEDLIAFLAAKIAAIVAGYNLPDGWEDLRQWVNQMVQLPGRELAHSIETFQKELNHYNAAKKQGRGRQLLCSISHSPYSVSEQMESAVLFTPQVYTNKQMLAGSNAKRNISSIAGTEMMLRQILMNQTQAVGKRFEDGKYRYLYFYPTYYFTPETNSFLQKAYANIAQTRFDSSIKLHFVDKNLVANFDRTRYQSVDSFLIDEKLRQKKETINEEEDGKKDRTFKLSYPEDKPLTFYFMALPPGRDPTDTESWVMPAWLGLAFPMILDVKTVVSESPIPPYRDGAEFEETVFLDSAPQAIRSLTRCDRFRLDRVLNAWEDNYGKKYSAPLNTLTAAYSIHLDVNSKQGKTGYDPNWGKLTELAINLETSPLYVFHYLKQWKRGKDADIPSANRIALYLYDFYPCFDPYVQANRTNLTIDMTAESPLNHPKNLTELYRQFYRAKSSKGKPIKANAILKPIDEAADIILKADKAISDDLTSLVAARLFKLMDRVRSQTAEGRYVIKERDQEREKILDFAKYFVKNVFEESFESDRARLAGRQLNIIRDTCEFLYRLEMDKERRQRQVQPLDTSNSSSEEEE